MTDSKDKTIVTNAIRHSIIDHGKTINMEEEIVAGTSLKSWCERAGLTTFQDIVIAKEKVPMLMRSYMQKLIDDEAMMRLSQVKKLNILDTTSFLPSPENGYGMPSFPEASDEEKEVIQRLDWYSFVPCFERGALKVNKFRYIVFEITKMEPEKQTIEINIEDYLKREGGCWERGVCVTMEVTALEADETGMKHQIQIVHHNEINFEDIYSIYSSKELGWTKDEYDIWKNVVIKNAREVTAEMMQKYHTNQCKQLASAFTIIIGRCNVMLELNKPSRPIQNKVSGAKRKVSYQNGEAPARKVRNVGKLRVQSEKVPRRPCMETVITYKVAEWTVRGHPRYYKNGKMVYIPASKRKRKALADTGQTTATTIRFRKMKGKE